MIKYFQNRFALTEKGAKDLRQGIVFSTLLNLVLMLPPTYLFFFLMEYLDNRPMNAPHRLWFYLLMAAGLMVVMLVVIRRQYDSTYTTIYNESAQRRISLAEKLRRLPLAFFIRNDVFARHSTTICFYGKHCHYRSGNVLLRLATRPCSVLGRAICLGGAVDFSETNGQGFYTSLPHQAWRERTDTGRTGVCAGNQIVQWRGWI